MGGTFCTRIEVDGEMLDVDVDYDYYPEELEMREDGVPVSPYISESIDINDIVIVDTGETVEITPELVTTIGKKFFNQ